MIIAVSVVKNEEYYLPSFLKHLNNYVDGYVFLDDGSTDNTINILENEPKVLKIIKNKVTDSIDYDEAGNRKKILKETYKLTKDFNNVWVLCCDPDERFETRFLKKMHDLTESNNPNNLYGLHFRELHNDFKHYRCDGIWNNKTKYILFPIQKDMDFSTYKFKRHVFWHYKEIEQNLNLTEYNLYHLKMIKYSDRVKRADLYIKLDPNLEVQPIGYDYLYNNEGMKLQKLTFINKYNYRFIPKDLKKYKEK